MPYLQNVLVGLSASESSSGHIYGSHPYCSVGRCPGVQPVCHKVFSQLHIQTNKQTNKQKHREESNSRVDLYTTSDVGTYSHCI